MSELGTASEGHWSRSTGGARFRTLGVMPPKIDRQMKPRLGGYGKVPAPLAQGPGRKVIAEIHTCIN